MFKEVDKERFWSRVKIKGPKDCWEWVAGKSNGYGSFKLRKHLPAIGSHRVAYELSNGPIPDGFHVMHKCDNRACCNPSHLIPGNNKANIMDSVRKGRRKGVTRNRPSGLTYKTGADYQSKWRWARDRMRDMRACGCTYKEISDWFGCAVMTVHNQLEKPL